MSFPGQDDPVGHEPGSVTTTIAGRVIWCKHCEQPIEERWGLWVTRDGKATASYCPVRAGYARR